MEDVLTLYEQPYDPKRPVICFDERPCQLIGDVVRPLPMAPGNPQREDDAYRRKGTCCLFAAFEPHTGRRVIQVRARRTKGDDAQFRRELVDRHAPQAQVIRLVQDNLNTHSAGSFYEAFPPDVAFRLAQQFEYHYTPKKGSWLNMVELELAALTKQCLDRRIGDLPTLTKEVRAWVRHRNRRRATVRWQFTTHEAREKFQRHYQRCRIKVPKH